MKERFVVLFLVICFIEVFSVVWAQETVHNASATDWATAGRSCDLLGHSGTRDLGNVRVNSVPAGTTGWIGAVKQYSSWVKMRDCCSVRPEFLSSATRFNNSKNDVISCVASCNGYIRFALSETQCYCFSTFPPVTATCTPHICTGTDDFCGGNSLAGHVDMVFYEIDNYYASATSGGQCMASSLSSHRRGDDDDDAVTTYTVNYTAISCSQRLPYFGCRIDSPPGYYVYSFTNSDGNWTDAAIQCNTNGRAIADTYDLRTFSGTYFTSTIGSMVWFGVFRREGMVWTKNLPSSNFYVNNQCMAAQVSSDGSLSMQTRSCSEQLPFFCEQQSEIVRVVGPSPSGAGIPASGVVAIVMVIVIVIAIVIAAVIIRKRIKRHIYVGRRHTELDNSSSDTSSTFSRRTLVGQSYTYAEEIRRSRFVSTRSYDTTEQELTNDYGYSEINRNNSQSLPQIADKEGPTYNGLDFKNLKLTLNESTGVYSHGNESYATLDRGDHMRNIAGFEQYDHMPPNKDLETRN